MKTFEGQGWRMGGGGLLPQKIHDLFVNFYDYYRGFLFFFYFFPYFFLFLTNLGESGIPNWKH